MIMEKTQAYIQANKDKFLNELMDLLRIPSISADPSYANSVLETAEATATFLKNAGADNVTVFPTDG